MRQLRIVVSVHFLWDAKKVGEGSDRSDRQKAQIKGDCPPQF